MKQLGQAAPDPEADFELFDRVVNVRTLGVAPYGLKGTIVGIHPGAWIFSSLFLSLIIASSKICCVNISSEI